MINKSDSSVRQDPQAPAPSDKTSNVCTPQSQQFTDTLSLGVGSIWGAGMGAILGARDPHAVFRGPTLADSMRGLGPRGKVMTIGGAVLMSVAITWPTIKARFE